VREAGRTLTVAGGDAFAVHDDQEKLVATMLATLAPVVTTSRVPAKPNEDAAAARRSRVLEAARWCFLDFGFSKTSLEDVAKRADISRTLLYRIFRDKEDLFTAVFAHWLVARHPEAQRAVADPGSSYERLLEVCR
jgi:AcrR family transcriptional regulator